MTVTLVPRTATLPVRLNNLQVGLVSGALLAAGAPDRDLLAPYAYVPSQVCAAWSASLFPALADLVLVETWDARRARLRPAGLLRVPAAARRDPTSWAALPVLHERTDVRQTPLGPLLDSLAGWLLACGGCTVDPG